MYLTYNAFSLANSVKLANSVAIAIAGYVIIVTTQLF